MKLADLIFDYPNELIATQPSRPSRVMTVKDNQPSEISVDELLNQFRAGDCLVINNTKVLKRRVFNEGLEILFLDPLKSDSSLLHWQVLMPSKKLSIGDQISITADVSITLVEKGRPQIVKSNKPLNEDFFAQFGQLALPPYIQKQRSQRQTLTQDEQWYQTDWAKIAGSFAAPTASLHFTENQLQQLRSRGVIVCEITLHVGLGTFLPVEVDDLSKHVMHSETAFIDSKIWQQIQDCKKNGHKIWALGTTVTRVLESTALGKIKPSIIGETDLMITPGFKFQIVDRLLTNFHQPQSTLLALVAGFSDLQTVKKCYQWAIDRKFKLFSYGDLTAWIK